MAWLQCIGSRDQEHPYCSSICCMIATKQAMLAKQRLDEVDCRVFVMDERAFNKEYTKYYQQAMDTHGVQYTRCRVSAIREDPKTNDLHPALPDADGQTWWRNATAWWCWRWACSRRPRSAELARMMGIELNAHGFCETDKFQPLQTSQPGVYVAGAFQSPKEIAETVFDAAGAAGEVMRVFHDALGGMPAPREYPVPGAARRTCRRSGTWRGKRLAPASSCAAAGRWWPRPWTWRPWSDFSRALPGVVHASTLSLGCFPEGIERDPGRHRGPRASTGWSWPPAAPAPTRPCSSAPCGAPG